MQRGGGLATVLITSTFFLGPSMGPLVGGYTMQSRDDWRWLMWVLLVVAGPIWLGVFFSQETSKKEILKRRAKARGLPGPPKPPPAAALKMLLVVTLLRPLKMLVTEPIVSSMSLYNAFVFGVLFAFFDAYPYVFLQVYHFTPGEVGLAFLGLLVGVLSAVVTFAIIDRTLYAKARRKAGAGRMPPPEERLYSSMVGSFGIPISLFWFAWTARSDVHWIVPILAGIPFGWGIVSLLVRPLARSLLSVYHVLITNAALQLGAMTYLIDSYGALFGASAIAANGLLRYTFGAVFPLFTVQMYDRLGIAWATSLLAFIGIAMLPIPFVLYRWGPALRRRSPFAGKF